jgi:hypothetical protein
MIPEKSSKFFMIPNKMIKFMMFTKKKREDRVFLHVHHKKNNGTGKK